jgi:hypothetical protein
MKKERSLLRKIAMECLGDIPKSRITKCFEKSLLTDRFPEKFYTAAFSEAWSRVRRFKPETLGKLGAHGAGIRVTGRGLRGKRQPDAGRTTLFQCHQDQWIDPRHDGIEILRRLAITTIIAEMVDIVLEQEDKSLVQKNREVHQVDLRMDRAQCATFPTSGF